MGGALRQREREREREKGQKWWIIKRTRKAKEKKTTKIDEKNGEKNADVADAEQGGRILRRPRWAFVFFPRT